MKKYPREKIPKVKILWEFWDKFPKGQKPKGQNSHGTKFQRDAFPKGQYSQGENFPRN